MGAAWCRDRAAAAHNSKSPLDRVIVQCVTQMCPSSESRPTTPPNNISTVSEVDRTKNRPLVGYPVPVHTTHRQAGTPHALNFSSNWEDASLRVPDSSDEGGPPVPPPRKKKIWREQQKQQPESWKSIARPPPPQPPTRYANESNGITTASKNKKRRQKTLSTVSLPNYNDLSLSVFIPGNIEKSTSGQKTPPRNESCISLPGKTSGLSSLSEATVEKFENCVRRCRSFGAFKPELLKVKGSPVNGRLSSESDDSFDGLDDWDLRVIEHCEAHEASPLNTMLPPQRQRKIGLSREELQTGMCEQVYVKDEIQDRMSGQTPQKEQLPMRTFKQDEEKEPLEVKPLERAELQTLEAGDLPIKTHQATENSTKISNVSHSVVADSNEESENAKKSQPEEKSSVIGNNINTSEKTTLEIPKSPKGKNTTLHVKINGSVPKANYSDINTIDDNSVVVYDFVNSRRSSGDRRLMMNGFRDTDIPTGLKTPPPTPENIKPKPDITQNNTEDDTTHSSLLRLLKEYQSPDGKLEDSGAQLVLRDLGVPATLRESVDQLPSVHKVTNASRGSSGRSSMTPSLSELEAALSDLLEASASRDDDDDVMPPPPVSMATPPVQQSLRVISPKPFTTFSTSFHSIQTTAGTKPMSQQHVQVAETSA